MNLGCGQMVSADFINERPAGPSFGEQRGWRGRRSGGLFSVAMRPPRRGDQVQEAQTSLLVADSRSGVQLAQPRSTKKLTCFGGRLFGGGGVAAGGGLRHPWGKLIAAASLHNYNKVRRVVRHDSSLQRNVGTLKQESAAGRHKKSGAVFTKLRP